MPIHTHYDNLMVARNAPPEVIRAAYRTLSQKYHPDRNPGDANAARIMSIVNTSYEILADPDRRRSHDGWIAEQEASGASVRNERTQPAPAKPSGYGAGAGRAGTVGNVARHFVRYWVMYGVAIGGALLYFEDKNEPSPGPKPYAASPPIDFDALMAQAPKSAGYSRPSTAPNGSPWPNGAAYVKGYGRLHMNGHSNVVIDNSRNDADVFAKLVYLDAATTFPVRQFFIPAGSTFELRKVRPGSYDVRYRDLSDGRLSRSDSFQIQENRTEDGVEFSNLTMTLYKVKSGNMQTHRLSEREFD